MSVWTYNIFKGVKQMDFTSFNKSNFTKIEWNVKTDGFTFKKLGDFYNAGKRIIQVFGFFFTKSENYGLQPIAIAGDCLVNLPTHHRDTISEMLKNTDAVNAIKEGACWLKIREYKSKYNKTCYDIEFTNAPASEPAPTPAPANEPAPTQANIF